MTKLPSLHQRTVSTARYEVGAGLVSFRALPQEPYGHVDDAIVMLTSVILCGFIYCVTMIF
jgi:hypothetical protein